VKGPGVLISLEGCDGCGKTTQAGLLCARLMAAGLPVGPLLEPGSVVREPGGTLVGEAIRDLLLHAPHEPDAWTEALLYAAARAELVARVLLPELGRGRVLVLDRFIDSSLAYQGAARGLGIDDVLAVNEPGLRGVWPDLTIVLEVDPRVAVRRLGAAPDRIEAQGLDFQRRVAEGFAEVVRRFPGRVRAVDGSRDVATVAADVAAAALAVTAAAGRGAGEQA
jgi:dTMP kinase